MPSTIRSSVEVRSSKFRLSSNTTRRLAVSPVQQTLMIFYRGGDGGAGGALVVGGILLHLGISASNYSTTCRCQLVCTTNISRSHSKSPLEEEKKWCSRYTLVHTLSRKRNRTQWNPALSVVPAVVWRQPAVLTRMYSRTEGSDHLLRLGEFDFERWNYGADTAFFYTKYQNAYLLLLFLARKKCSEWVCFSELL